MADTVLSASGLIKRFPQGDAEIEVLHGISLELRSGEIVAILGPSGAGKSTLLHVLGLMEQADGGALEIEKRAAQHLSATQRAELRNRFVGFLFQFHHLLPELSVLENVVLPARIARRDEGQSVGQAKRLLDTIGLRPHLAKTPAHLSGGEQQRVALARALMNGPRLILADEPTGNLDKETGEQVLRLLWDESRRLGAATVIVTHQEDIAQRADRWIRLRDGRIESASTSRTAAI